MEGHSVSYMICGVSTQQMWKCSVVAVPCYSCSPCIAVTASINEQRTSNLHRRTIHTHMIDL